MHLTVAALLAYGSILALAANFGATYTIQVVKHNSTIPLSVKHNVTAPIAIKYNGTILLSVKNHVTAPIAVKQNGTIPCNNTLAVKPTSNVYMPVDTTITVVKVPNAPTATTVLPGALVTNAASVFFVGTVSFFSFFAAVIVM